MNSQKKYICNVYSARKKKPKFEYFNQICVKPAKMNKIY